MRHLDVNLVILVIGCVWPEPNSSAAGSRMLQLLHFFQAKNYEITFVSPAARSEFSINLNKLNIASEVVKMNHPSFDELLIELQPNMVLFDRFMTEEQFGWRVDATCPEALKILDTEDLHFLRKTRAEAYKKNIAAKTLYLESDLTKREIASIYRCDLSLIISEVEMELLKDKFKIPDQLLHYLPFLLDSISEEKIATLPQFNSRENFISIGNFLHEPNWNAVVALKEKIWPLIKQKLPKAALHIYGAYPSHKVWNLHNEKDRFIVKGRAENAEEIMRNARLCLAPIQFGAGLKGKLIQAMQCGTPSVTSPVGSEGIAGTLDWSGAICQTPQDFAEKAVQLYTNKKLWNTARENGFKIINSRFDKTNHSEAFSKQLTALISNLETRRNENFIGKMLQHHQHRSTYFMAKFIEEKERNRS